MTPPLLHIHQFLPLHAPASLNEPDYLLTRFNCLWTTRPKLQKNAILLLSSVKWENTIASHIHTKVSLLCA